MNTGSPQFEAGSRLVRLSDRISPNYVPLARHPNVSVQTEGDFLKSMARLQSAIENLPICFTKEAELSLVYSADSVLHVYSRKFPFPDYEILGADRVQYKRNHFGSALLFEYEEETIRVQLHEHVEPVVYVAAQPEVVRTSSPWRAPARGSIHDRSTESGGSAGGGER